ncbi:PREDICTED: interleukin-18 receptor accessory protein [Elephantulus edwardii]|uniref:interleukin-18 receptor accessory protein n=1 Tax=Elephantulus edwardii TaxID=28737 RepID=UPI0003F0CFA7|nr:PREDICTED: interleukin-18 receptor accessory protein [Elephantulus edwardii]
MILYLGCIFLWIVSRERIKGVNVPDCSTKKLIWTYHARNEEEFLLFCDLPELQKSHFSHRNQLSPAQVPEQGPCSGSKNLSDVQWYLQSQNEDPQREISRNYPRILNALYFSPITMKDAGSYICRPRIRNPQDDGCCIKMIVVVKPKKNTSCSDAGHEQTLRLGRLASISCPGLNCEIPTQSPEVTWYHDGKLLPNKRSNPMSLGEVYDFNSGTYTCDYKQSNNTNFWIVRAVIQVKTVVEDTKSKPDILEPDKDILEVGLGKPLNLTCKVRFGFEMDFKPIFKWYIKDAGEEKEVKICHAVESISSSSNEVFQCTYSLKEVTQSDLQKKFICFAKNSKGNDTKTIQLKVKKGVVFIYILPGTIIIMVGLLTASALLYTYWIEIVLLYRTHQNKDETLGDKKEFDAFVSYAKWNSLESQATSSLSEENLALNLIPEVLENKYGYTLCLLERDVAPGGVYAEDVVNIIKKSRRGIFILSPDYFSGPNVFELEAAVNLALDDQTLKLILIKFCSFKEPESLPHRVKKALSVLPTITWRGLKSVPPSSRFWTKMRYHMPMKSACVTPCHFSQR